MNALIAAIGVEAGKGGCKLAAKIIISLVAAVAATYGARATINAIDKLIEKYKDDPTKVVLLKNERRKFEDDAKAENINVAK